MRTALVDNSLCVYTLRDDVNPEYIYRYIESLREAGVRYIELDFRSLMKLRTLPSGIGYIFRPVDPMFMKLREVFDFDYIHLSLSDIKKNIKTDIPAMLGFSAGENLNAKVFHCAKQLYGGEITAVRLRGSFPFMSREASESYIAHLKNEVPVPIDICPMNGRRTALDTALKFTAANVDSLTLSMGQSEKFCALDDYFFALLMMFNKLPKDYNLAAICRASVYQRYIFKNSVDLVEQLFKIYAQDSRNLYNADTGEKVLMKMGIRNSNFLRKTYVSALEKMASDEDIPEDIFRCIEDALSRFDVSLCNEAVCESKKQAFLN